MDPEVFDLVYNGFWDLYSFKPQIRDVSARKLQAWIQKIKLISGPDRSPPVDEAAEEEKPAPVEGEDENEEGSDEKKLDMDLDAEDTIDSISAIVRLKIPKIPVEYEQDDEGNDIIVEVVESDLEDIPFEDKCLAMETKRED